MKPYRLELADVFRTHQNDFLARWNSVLSRQQRKALRDIRDCRTAVLGGHLYECDRCGHQVKVFNSYHNRHCPECQATARAKWLAHREAELLPVPYFHVILLPGRIGRLALQNRRRIYTSFSRPLPKLCSPSPPILNISEPPSASLPCCTPGVRTCIFIRTCTASCPAAVSPPMAPAGSPAGRSLSSFLIRCSAVGSAHYFCSTSARLFAKVGFASRASFAIWPSHPFQSLCEAAAKLEWVVHVKPPFGGPPRVLKYLARYTHRVAISNHRLRALENGHVTFDWKDYADHSRTKTMTLDAVEFIRRFLLHVLPPGLVRIRHFGFLANRVRKQKLIQCRALLAASQPISSIDSDGSTTSVEDPHACPICKRGRLVIIELLCVETTAVQDSS